ncbi:MAG: hypothetical protein AMXMBFR64_36370 [Myxococcales bacterium]
MRGSPWLAALVAALLPAQAAAFDVELPVIGTMGFDVTESLLIRWLDDNFDRNDRDDQVLGILSKTNLIVTAGPATAGVRLDVALFFNEAECGAGTESALCFFKDYIRPEKTWGTWDFGDASLTAGDVYASFGRGLVLSVRKIDELGIDTTIRGGRAALTTGPLSVQVVAGATNVQNVDNTSQQFIEDPDDVLVGAEASLTLPGGVELGVRGVQAFFEGSASIGHEERTTIGGASLSLGDLFGVAALYLEGAILRHTDEGSGARIVDEGGAVYGSLSVFAGAFNVLLEGKHYRKFQLQAADPRLASFGIVYAEPPALERFDQIVPNNSDTTGGRLRAEYSVLSTGTRIHANGLFYVYNNREEDPLEDGAWALHAYGGVRQDFGLGFFADVSGGWREERELLTDELVLKMWHAEGEVNLPLGGPHHLGLKVNHQSEVKRGVPLNHSFIRGQAIATWSLAPILRVAALYGYTTRNEVLEPVHNVAGEVSWDFASWGTLTAFGGQIPGGILCVSGTCRSLPAFSGASLETVLRF